MEAHGSFHETYSWKMQLIEAMQAFISVDNGNVHVLPWKPLLTSMEVNLLLPASMEISTEVNLLPPTSMEAYIDVGENVHGTRSNGSRLTPMEVFVEAAGSYRYSWT